MQNRVFFPQSVLDEWIVAGTVDLQKGELTLRGAGAGRRYSLEEAVRVLREVSGAGDKAELIGRVKTRAQLEGQGAEIVEGSMLFGEAAYDVEPGWVGVPVGTFADYLASRAAETGKKGKAKRDEASGPPPQTDEDLLARLLGPPG